MEQPTKKGMNINSWLKLSFKILVTAVCLWYVSTKIDFTRTLHALQQSDWLLLIPAVITFMASKMIAAVRLNIYFKNINIHLPQWPHMKLYWLGMFYNLFLPGSISGDAYKVIMLSKKFDSSYRKTTAAVLFDRFSGLLGLGIILALFSYFVLSNQLFLLLASGAVLATLFFYLVTRRYFPDFRPSFYSTLFLGLIVQAVQVLCVYLIMAGLGIEASRSAYIFIFLVSSVASVLPISIGGLGIREVVFLEGSLYFGLEEETSVIISLLFYLITLFTSAWGILFVFKLNLSKRE